MAAAEAVQIPGINLETLSEEQILDTRICDLPLRIEGTWLQERVAQLYRELKAKNLVFEPYCYLADEWLTPEGEPVIGIPFYLAHPRLIALEKKMMLEAEGETIDGCMKLLRHEAGHALSYAYGLHKKKSWQKVFGHSSQTYGETYRYRAYSKSFVRHLDRHYAQYHPDEDFVETFAVWLTPGLDWQTEYQGWKAALDKLMFVDRQMKLIAGKPPLLAKGRQYWRASKLQSTLRRYYQRRRHSEAENFPDFHDQNLRSMFALAQASGETRPSVAKLLQSHRKLLLGSISGWTGERRYMVSEIIKAVHARCKALQLVSDNPEAVTLAQLTTYLTTLLMNYRYTNRMRGNAPTGNRMRSSAATQGKRTHDHSPPQGEPPRGQS